MVVQLPIIFSFCYPLDDYAGRACRGLRFAVLVMLSSLAVRLPREELHDDAAGGSIGCAGSAREAHRKWAQALADTREAETLQPVSHLMAPLASERPRWSRP